MIPLSPARRTAEEFNDLVDGIRTGATDERFGDLLATVASLRNQPAPQARGEFVSGLREQLLAAADTLLIPATDRLAPVIPIEAPSRGRRRVSVAAAALIVVGGSAGMAAAAESALPGDPLYSLKRGIESAQVSLSGSDANRSSELLGQAATRLGEVAALIDDGASATTINHTLASFERSTTSGAEFAFADFTRSGDPDVIVGLRAALAEQLADLDSLATVAPPESAAAFQTARLTVTGLDSQAMTLCGTCGPGTSLGSTPEASRVTLSGLLKAPVDDAADAAALEAAAAALAERANQIAQETGSGGATTGPGTAPDGGATGGLTDPNALTVESDPISALNSGVDTLLEQIDDTLAPVTDALTDGLTDLNTSLG